MIVMRERTKAGEDLIEEVLGMELLQALAVDPVAHPADAFAVDGVNDIRHSRRRAHQHTSIPVIERARPAHQGDSAPCTSAPPHGTDQKVWLNRRALVPDKA